MHFRSVGVFGILAIFLSGCGREEFPNVDVGAAHGTAQIAGKTAENDNEIPIPTKALEKLNEAISKPLQSYFDAHRLYEAEVLKGDNADKNVVEELKKNAVKAAAAVAETRKPILTAAGMPPGSSLQTFGDSESLRVYARPSLVLTLKIRTNSGKVVGYELKGTRKKKNALK